MSNKNKNIQLNFGNMSFAFRDSDCVNKEVDKYIISLIITEVKCSIEEFPETYKVSLK